MPPKQSCMLFTLLIFSEKIFLVVRTHMLCSHIRYFAMKHAPLLNIKHCMQYESKIVQKKYTGHLSSLTLHSHKIEYVCHCEVIANMHSLLHITHHTMLILFCQPIISTQFFNALLFFKNFPNNKHGWACWQLCNNWSKKKMVLEKASWIPSPTPPLKKNILQVASNI